MILIRSFSFWSRLLLGFLFVFSGTGKVADVRGFSVAVSDYKILPEVLVLPFSYAVAYLELILGFLLLLGYQIRKVGLAVSGLIVLFMAAIAVSIARGLDIDCGCFDLPLLGPSETGWNVLLRDLVLLVFSLSLLIRSDFERIKNGNEHGT